MSRRSWEHGPIGVLAYDGDDPVGWAAVARRADTTFARPYLPRHHNDSILHQ